jgi:hypothetical protein
MEGENTQDEKIELNENGEPKLSKKALAKLEKQAKKD